MPALDMFDRDQGAALARASSRLASDFPVTFGEGFEAAWSEGMLFSASIAAYNAREEALRQYVSELREQTGEQIGPKFPGERPLLENVNAELTALKLRRPEIDIEPMSDDDLEARAERLSELSRERWRETANREKTLGGKVGFWLAGPLAAGVVDPINLATFPLAAPASLGVLRTAGVWGGLAMGTQAAIEVAGAPFRERVEPGYLESGQPELNILGAGAFGAAIGGGFKGAATAWARLKTAQWPRAVRDAGNVIEREAIAEATNPYRGAGLEGEMQHRARLAQAEAALDGADAPTVQDEFALGDWRPGRVTASDGSKVDVRYEVVDVSELVTSHGDDFTINPDYPAALQPRERGRASSQEQVLSMAARLDPDRLGPSPDAASGAPIVGPDGIVESGNARVMAIRRAYGEDAQPAEAYRAALRAQGFDVEGKAAPVLVARRLTALDPGQREAFTLAANRATAARLSTAEQALADARLIDGSALDALQPGPLGSAANRAFRDRILGRLPESERAGMRDRVGRLSREGTQRLEAALLARAYGDPALLGRALEDADSNIKSLAGALTDAAGRWSRMRDGVSRGDLPAAMDITDDLLGALRIVMRARDEGRRVSEIANQGEMFDRPTAATRALLGFMFKGDDLTRPTSRKAMGEMLEAYADEALKNTNDARLFGEPLGADDVLGTALRRSGRDDLASDAATETALTRDADELGEATLHEVDQMLAADPERVVTIMAEDGVTVLRRPAREMLAEADDEIRAAREIEACAIGREAA